MDTPTIADKVKFWQEQDRINQVLIPRVIKTHELLVETSKQMDKFTEDIANSESRVTDKLKNEIVRVNENFTSMEEKLNEFEKKLLNQSENCKEENQKTVNTIRIEIESLKKERQLLSEHLNDLAGIKKLESDFKKIKILCMVVSVTAFVVSIVSFIFSLVR